jgi:hypothetical protein
VSNRSLALFLALFCFAAPPASLGATTQPGWRMEQKSFAAGKVVVYMTPKMLRVDNPELMFTIIANADDGTVNLFNRAKKLRHKVPLKNFHLHMTTVLSFSEGVILPASVKWKKSPKGKLQCYQAKNVETMFRGAKAGGYLAGNKYEKEITYDACFDESLGLTKELCAVLCEVLGMPNLGGVPVSEIKQYGHGDSRVELETKNIKAAPFGPDWFALPSAYKYADNINDIITRGDGTILDEFLGK